MIPKFRGLTKDGKWVYGWYLQSKLEFPKSVQVHFIINCSGVTRTGLALAKRFGDFPGYHKVIPETVGQYTGYENLWQGDIIRLIWEKDNGEEFVYLAEIIIKDYGFQCRPLQETDNWTIWLSAAIENLSANKDIEVIGNIHDTPELLKNK